MFVSLRSFYVFLNEKVLENGNKNLAGKMKETSYVLRTTTTRYCIIISWILTSGSADRRRANRVES